MNFACRRWNLRKALTDMQPPDTVVMDLDRSARSILLGMHRKARYCVRRAFHRGVVVETAGVEALPRWHGLFRFKTRFGGTIRHLRGCWDYPFDEERYFSLALPASGRDAYHAR